MEAIAPMGALRAYFSVAVLAGKLYAMAGGTVPRCV